jgi:hypothetical protein
MNIRFLSSYLCFHAATVTGFAPSPSNNGRSFTALNAEKDSTEVSRRSLLSTIATSSAAFALASVNQSPAVATDVDDYLKSGQVNMPMGVSGQAGKSRPETGIVFRDGSEVSRDTRSGNVLAEIVLAADSKDPVAVLTSFTSPWALAKGSLFDVECRDSSTGDSAFLSLSGKANGKAVSDLPTSFFLNNIFSSTGRFSFYGPPTDVKVKKSYMDGNNRVIELGFSILSQSTGAEIPRLAIVVASIPEGTDQAVMLATSSTATRWRKGTEKDARKTAESFKASASPKTGMKVRAKVRNDYSLSQS